MADQSKGDPIVFVVDDEAEVREGLKDLLASVGLRSATFGSTTEFLQSKLPNEVSCLILDVRLPGLGGLDLQAELAVSKISIPIIFITGHGDIPMTVKAMKAGAVEFLTKRFAIRIFWTQSELRSTGIAPDRSVKGKHATCATISRLSAHVSRRSWLW